MKVYHCTCGHKWQSRVPYEPLLCPGCGGNWRTPRMSGHGKATCNKCGHTWVKRTERPGKCPRCGLYNWQEKRKFRPILLRCLSPKCGAVYTGRLGRIPVCCGRCRHGKVKRAR